MEVICYKQFNLYTIIDSLIIGKLEMKSKLQDQCAFLFFKRPLSGMEK